MPPVFGYRPYVNRNVLQSGYPICTAVTFNPVGDIKPVAFGVVMDGMRYRYKITAVKDVKDNHGAYIFDCEYIDLGRIKAVRLVFDVANCRWMVG